MPAPAMTPATPAGFPSLSATAFAADARRPRSRQTVPGASDIGPCLRRAAYLHHGVTPSDPKEASMPAILGTWLHEAALTTMSRAHGLFMETLLEHPSGTLRGHTDLLWLDTDHAARLDPSPRVGPVTGWGQVVLEDLKTKADDRLLDTVRKVGPPPSEIRQVYTYAWLLSTFGAKVDMRRGPRARQQALADLGPITVDRVRLRYLARDRGEELVWEQDVDPDLLAEAADRFSWMTDSGVPEDMPREQRGPGLSYVCDSCPFVTACWGASKPDHDGIWPQHVRVLEGETTYEEQAGNYLHGMALERDAKVLKEDAKAVLTALTEPTQLGDTAIVSWTGGKPRDPVDDVAAMKDLLERAGVPIPKRDGGRTARAISVRPAKPRPTKDA